MMTSGARYAGRAAEVGVCADLDVVAFLSLLGKTINFTGLYGLVHNLTDTTIRETFVALDGLLKQRPGISITLTEGTLQADGAPIEPTIPFANVLIAKLRDINLSGFTIQRGLTLDEFRAIIRSLATLTSSSTADAVTAALQAQGVGSHFMADRAVYKRVGARDTISGQSPAASPGAASPIVVSQMLAFLKGEVAATKEQTSQMAKDLAASPDRFAQLILDAVRVRQTAATFASGESLADIVVGCLRRTLEAVAEAPANQTSEGRINLRKSLLVLEQCVLDRLHRAARAPDPKIDHVIARAFREAQENLELSVAAAEYVRRKEALAKVEQWMVNYARRETNNPSAGDALKQRLSAAGLSPEGWQELVLKSSTETGSSGQAVTGIAPELGVLSMLLSQLDELMQANARPERIVPMSEAAVDAAKAMSVGTSARIQRLGTALNLSPFATKDLLAEICQELAQPISVMNCTIEAITRGILGPVEAQQRDMLGLAKNCGYRVRDLLNQMRSVVGVPASLKPEDRKP